MTDSLFVRSGAGAVLLAGGVLAGGATVAPPPSAGACSCSHTAQLSMIHCFSSSFLPLQSRPITRSASLMSGTPALFLSPAPCSAYWADAGALLVPVMVPVPVGLGPLVALAAISIRLRHLDFRPRRLGIPLFGPCISHSRPDSFKALPHSPGYSRFAYVSMMWYQSQRSKEYILVG